MRTLTIECDCEALGDGRQIDKEEVGRGGLSAWATLGRQLLVEQLKESLVDLDWSTSAH